MLPSEALTKIPVASSPFMCESAFKTRFDKVRFSARTAVVVGVGATSPFGLPLAGCPGCAPAFNVKSKHTNVIPPL